MTQQTLNLGTTANDGTGDALRVAGGKINDNFTELYAASAAAAPLASPAFTGTPTAPTAAASTNTTQIATTAMVQSALAAYIAAQDVLVFKGAVDCSASPNYPAADAGHVYKVSVAGKIGGSSGPNVEVGDVLTCVVDSTAAGTQASVGASWIISQVNIDGAVTGPTSAIDARIAVFDGTTGKLIKDSGSTISDLTTGATDIANAIHAATGKTTPVDADELALVDSAASNALKKLTWANLKATLKSYFDTLYPGYTAPTPYTPTVLAGSGTFTSASATCSYEKFGKTVIAAFVVTITTNGTAAAYITVSTPLPVSNNAAVWCRETAVTGTYGVASASSGGSVIVITKSDQTYLGGNGYVIEFTIAYKTT